MYKSLIVQRKKNCNQKTATCVRVTKVQSERSGKIIDVGWGLVDMAVAFIKLFYIFILYEYFFCS